MSARTRSVSAVIQSVSAQPVLWIDVLLLLSSSSWARSFAGPLLLDLRVVRVRDIASSGRGSPHFESQGLESAPRRQLPAARCAPSGDTWASLLRGWMINATGWTCKIRVGLGFMRNARMAIINRVDSLAILPFIACRGKTPLQNGKAGAHIERHIFANDLQPNHPVWRYSLARRE